MMVADSKPPEMRHIEAKNTAKKANSDKNAALKEPF